MRTRSKGQPMVEIDRICLIRAGSGVPTGKTVSRITSEPKLAPTR